MVGDLGRQLESSEILFYGNREASEQGNDECPYMP